MDVYKYPVFFECQTLDLFDKERIRKYFKIRRKSGGGDCGQVETVGDCVYKIAFKDQTDQEEVLQRNCHVLELAGRSLTLNLRESLDPPPTTHTSESRLSSCLSMPVETSPSGHEDVLRGFSSVKQEKISSTCQLGQSRPSLLWQIIEKELGEFMPGVKVTRGNSSQLVLEGSANEVQTARQLVTDKTPLVMERVVSGVSPILLTFLSEAYGRPGALGCLLGFGSQVQVDLGVTELRLFTLSSEKLDQAEKALLGEFGEEMIDVPNCDSFPPELMSIIEKKVMEMNQHRCRVVARYVPGCRVQLLGHVKEVQELREEIQAFLIDQASGRAVGCPQQYQSGLVSEAGVNSRWEETVADASYSLPWGLQVVVRQGDITKEEADALVNAANGDLDHGGGVAAALSRAGGPEVQQASRDLVRQVGRLATGSVVETTGGMLPCKILLHAVGPVGGSVGGEERPLLEKTVKTALDLAENLELQTLAMPCISSGIFGVPLKVCSEAIVSAVRDFGREQHILTKVTLIDVHTEAVKAMQEACDRLLLGRGESSEWEGGSRTTTTTTNTSHGDTDTYTRGAVASETCVQVEIVQGTIEKQQVDALVSPMDGNEPLSTRVGNALFEAAGHQLLAAFRRGSQDQIAPGDTVLVEGLSGLSSSRVFFLSCTQWKYNSKALAVQALRRGVRNILTSCDDKGIRSVAFPVVGTGIVLKFPDEVATRVLLEEIHKYEKSRANRSLSLVLIVVHPNDRESTKALQTAQKTLCLSSFKSVDCPKQALTLLTATSLSNTNLLLLGFVVGQLRCLK
ncbi:protein mono-ADP-ribosyltransferase PARP14-like isoform X2 [Esox lucius]|uniref:protein mono-ADP-ribosyltransferase PARP14-like isoform X2 n=1 Tax=Esox lucius TaxID=8010 RepID=UPI001476ABBE|nr:protein mono-ADP-ribosyltransferase PARP14-like isoform X2 [Esox lucius]